MYIYFQNSGIGTIEIDPKVEIRVVRPKMTKSLHSFIWTIASRCFNSKKRGQFVEYQLLTGGGIVSRAEVVSWIPIFPFMPHDALEIGPCSTDKEFRGNGYYPMLLKKIQEDFPDRKCCMLVEEKNIASIHGVKKAGFEAFAKGIKNRFGRYVIIPDALD